MNELLLHLAKKLDEDATAHSDDLAKGSAKDHGEYKYHCGIIRGLWMAKNHIIELSERLENDED